MSGLRDKQHAFCVMLGKFLIWLDEQGYKVQQGDAWRSTDKLFVPMGKEGFDDDDGYSYQELLFYNQKTKTTYSKHNDRLAQDLVIWKDGKQLVGEEFRPIGEKWESLGGRWGGRFGLKLINGEWVNRRGERAIGWDAGHFEYDQDPQSIPQTSQV